MIQVPTDRDNSREGHKYRMPKDPGWNPEQSRGYKNFANLFLKCTRRRWKKASPSLIQSSGTQMPCRRRRRRGRQTGFGYMSLIKVKPFFALLPVPDRRSSVHASSIRCCWAVDECEKKSHEYAFWTRSFLTRPGMVSPLSPLPPIPTPPPTHKGGGGSAGSGGWCFLRLENRCTGEGTKRGWKFRWKVSDTAKCASSGSRVFVFVVASREDLRDEKPAFMTKHNNGIMIRRTVCCRKVRFWWQSVFGKTLFLD